MVGAAATHEGIGRRVGARNVSSWDALRLPLLLALLAIAGIIGMLLLEGIGDAVSFVLALLPLVVGGWLARKQARS